MGFGLWNLEAFLFDVIGSFGRFWHFLLEFVIVLVCI